ncbi:MAG: hypothetical protein DRH17_12520 [Deltaproteobacteria bacterium]|nr:MAG: hypothetical protein DRH17_12520 [Deltaproteobacteria bacterium]
MKKVFDINDVWAVYIVNGEAVPLPKKKLLCTTVTEDGWCTGEMILHDFRCYKHTTMKPELVHVDIHVKCPKCGYWRTYGLAVPEKIAGMLARSKYHNRVLRDELPEIYGGKIDKQVVKRIKAWGYWAIVLAVLFKIIAGALLW